MENRQQLRQQILDSLLATINLTGRNDTGNYIKELRFIERKGCKDMWNRPLPDGDYVRIVFADHPDRDDGYYDISVEASSEWGMMVDVVKYLNAKNLV